MDCLEIALELADIKLLDEDNKELPHEYEYPALSEEELKVIELAKQSPCGEWAIDSVTDRAKRSINTVKALYGVSGDGLIAMATLHYLMGDIEFSERGIPEAHRRGTLEKTLKRACSTRNIFDSFSAFTSDVGEWRAYIEKLIGAYNA